MRPALIAVPAQGLGRRSRLSDRGKPVEVETLVPERPVQTLDVGVVRRRSRAREVHPRLVKIRPQINNLTGELRSIAHRECGWSGRCLAQLPAARDGPARTTREEGRLIREDLQGPRLN